MHSVYKWLSYVVGILISNGGQYIGRGCAMKDYFEMDMLAGQEIGYFG
jgi:hypothetical protein